MRRASVFPVFTFLRKILLTGNAVGAFFAVQIEAACEGGACLCLLVEREPLATSHTLIQKVERYIRKLLYPP